MPRKNNSKYIERHRIEEDINMDKINEQCWICRRTKKEVQELLTDEWLGPDEYMVDSINNWTLPVCIGCRDIIEKIIVDSGVVLETELEERISNLKITIE